MAEDERMLIVLLIAVHIRVQYIEQYISSDFTDRSRGPPLPGQNGQK
jgi:hypothetical protein